MDKPKDEILPMPIEGLNLSLRTSSRLKEFNIHTVGELVQKTEGELLFTKRGLGKKSLREIEEFLAEHGLYLAR